MGSKSRKCMLRVSALCVCLTFGAAFAQEGDASGPIPSVEQATEVEQDARPAESAVEAAEEVPTPVAEVAPVNEAPEKVRTAEKPEKVRRETRSGDIVPNIGFRAGFGVSAFAGHKAVPVRGSPLDPDLYGPGAGIDDLGNAVVRLWGGVSFTLGLSVAWDLTNLVDLGVPYEIVSELQYTLYTGYGNRHTITPDRYAEHGYYGWPELYEASVQLHSIELPVLARFRYDRYYLELGPQFGVNAFSKISAGAIDYKPFSKAFAFGPAVGFGIDLDGVIAGLRWQMDVLEYASKTNGRPWAVHATATLYPF